MSIHEKGVRFDVLSYDLNFERVNINVEEKKSIAKNMGFKR